MFKRTGRGRKSFIGVLRKINAYIKKPEGFFVVFALFFGSIFVFVTPPIQVYDERAHFFQAYAFSNLDLKAEKREYGGRYHYGPELPRSVFIAGEVFIAGTAGNSAVPFSKGLYKEYLFQPLNPQITDHREMGSGYSPVVYIPQIIGISIGKAFNASPLIMIWLARFFTLIAWVALVYLTIRLIPFGKWAVAIIALNPMAVFLSASLSADVMTTGLAFLFFALIASTFVIKKEAITKLRLATISTLLALLAITKPTSLVFGLLLFTIPWNLLTKKWKYLVYCLASILIAMLVAYLWNTVVAEANQFNAQNQALDRLINPSQQLAIVLQSPLEYIKTILMNYIIAPVDYPGNLLVISAVGSLGWGETILPLWATALYIVVALFAVLYTCGRGYVLTKIQKTILVVVFVLFWVGNITAMYLYFTGVGQNVILGVQGRYFIPVLILLTALFTGKNKIIDSSEQNLSKVLALLMSIILFTTLVVITVRYYTL